MSIRILPHNSNDDISAKPNLENPVKKCKPTRFCFKNVLACVVIKIICTACITHTHYNVGYGKYFKLSQTNLLHVVPVWFGNFYLRGKGGWVAPDTVRYVYCSVYIVDNTTVLLCLSCMSKPYTTTAMCTEICRLLKTRTVLLRTIVTKGCICKQNRFSIRTFNYFKFPAHISIMHDPNCLVQDSCFKLSASCCLIQAVLFKLADTSCLIQAV